MKMMLLTIFILMFSIPVFAPVERVFYINKTEGINPYEAIWNATCAVESSFDPFAYNSIDPNGGSFGIVQIGRLKLNEYNEANGTNYHLQDCYDVGISRKIFMWHCMKYTDIETASKKWNGSGPLVEEYYKKVKYKLIK